MEKYQIFYEMNLENILNFFMIRFVSIVISCIFHPLIISISTFFILIYHNDSLPENINQIFIICLLFSNVIPIFTVLFLKYKNIISDLDASIKEQRILPLLLAVFYSSLGFIALRYYDANQLVQGLMFCYITNTIITIIITKYWKISIHAMGITAPITVLYLFGYHNIILMFIITLLVGISRIIIKAHNLKQVLAGSLLGFILTFIQITLFFI